jgi:hypothetical protein
MPVVGALGSRGWGKANGAVTAAICRSDRGTSSAIARSSSGAATAGCADGFADHTWRSDGKTVTPGRLTRMLSRRARPSDRGVVAR